MKVGITIEEEHPRLKDIKTCLNGRVGGGGGCRYGSSNEGQLGATVLVRSRLKIFGDDFILDGLPKCPPPQESKENCQ